MVKIDFISDINKKFGDALAYRQVDKFMRRVLWWHLAAFLLLVFLNSVVKIALKHPNPFSWRVISPTEAIYAVVIALIATIVPSLLSKSLPKKNHYLWRILVTVALVFYSYLFVFISGGSIEMHFHFFIIAALVVMWADWRLGWILLVLTAIHHTVLNYVQPGWVYFYGRNDFSVISHAIPVIVMVIFTTVLAEIIRGGVMALELTNKGVESVLKKSGVELK